MSFKDSRLTQWEHRLMLVFDEIDHVLENEHGHRYPRHPVRPPAGTTARPEQDGLFNIGASFSAGFGSRLGPGYVIEVRISTLREVPPEERMQITGRVVELLREKLPRAFPDQHLEVKRDGNYYKIVGDLSFTQTGPERPAN